MREIQFANILFRGLSKDILLKEEKGIKIIITVNSEYIAKANQNPRFLSLINDTYATFDGQIPFILAKILNKKENFEKISGSDFIFDICKYAEKHAKKIFLLGGLKSSNEKAVAALKNKYQISINGYSPEYKTYPFTPEHNDVILKKIKKARPDFLLVGFGTIKQEMWIYEHRNILHKIGIKWAIGVGGTFEFVSGNISRAPVALQKFGMEGLYRFLMEPRWFRFKRLLISLSVFKFFLYELLKKK